MKHILKAKKRFLCLLLAGALAACLSPAALAAPDGVEVAPGYDYTRFKDAGITLNVYNWGEYISNEMCIRDRLYTVTPTLTVSGPAQQPSGAQGPSSSTARRRRAAWRMASAVSRQGVHLSLIHICQYFPR